MNRFRKLAEYFFPHDSDDFSLLLLAIAAAASGAGIAAVVLWIAHSSSALSAAGDAQPECLERCEKICATEHASQSCGDNDNRNRC